MQKIRLKDVAQRAGVAMNTASTILNRRPNSWASKETEERVFQAATDLGYKPNRAAQSLRLGRFDSFALVISDFNDPYCAAFADAMKAAAWERGYELFIETSRHDPAGAQRIVAALENRNVDGVAAIAPVFHASGELPFLSIGVAGEAGASVDSVLVDFAPGLREAVGALVALGHRRFALIGASEVTGELLRRTLAEAGIGECATAQCGAGAAAACEVSAMLLRVTDQARPTAIIAQSDLHAMGAMRAAMQAGLSCPCDLSIVSMENSPLAACLPVALSAIARPIAGMAERVVQMLISRVETRGLRRHTEQAVFASEFVARESIGPARRE